MSSVRAPSPAHSQVATPRPRNSRRTRSVCSTTSNTSVCLTTVIQESFKMSPMPNRKSVLNDETDIQIPGRQSWWRRIGDNSRNITEIMDERDNQANVKVMNIGEEFDVEILSQEKENLSVDLPESSDCESIHSIVIPQRKIFSKHDKRPKKTTKEIINNKDNLPKIRKSYFDETNIDKDINVLPKKLFNQGKQKTKPVFTAALLNASANKTFSKSMERPSHEVQGQVRNLFGNRPATKRKNVFSAFLLSDSEDEIPDIQPQLFRFLKKLENQHVSKQLRRSDSQSSLRSSPSNITDAEMDEWQHLPSSTMVEHEFEACKTTPLKRRRSSQVTEPEQSQIDTSKNNFKNKSNQSILSPKTNKSHKSNQSMKSNPDEIYTELNIIKPDSQSLNKAYSSSNVTTNKNKSLKELSMKNNSKLEQDILVDKTLTDENMEVEENERTLTEDHQNSNESYNEDFTLEYENDDEQIFDESLKDRKNDQEPNAINEKLQEKEQEEIVDENAIEQENMSDQEDEVQNLNVENIIEQGNRSSQKHITQCNQEENEFEQQNLEVIESEHEEIVDSNQEDKGNQVIEYNQSDAKGDVFENNQKQKRDNSKQIIEMIEPERSGKYANSHIEEQKQSDNDYGQQGHKTNEHNDEQDKGNVISYNNNEQENTDSTTTNELPTSTQDTTGRYRQDTRGAKSPEAVLHDKTNCAESFTTHGRNTSISKSKTIIKELNVQPSLCPARESTGLTDGTINSSAEGSGWDSHRTTRKTLRQTFGKDFTPRKSLRTLVMERSAKRKINQDQVSDKSKRQTNINEFMAESKQQDNINDITSVTLKKPMANSTEYPVFESYQEQEQEADFVRDIEQEQNELDGEQEQIDEFEFKNKQEQIEKLELVRKQKTVKEIESGRQQMEVEEFNKELEQDEEIESNREQEEVEEFESDTQQEQIDEFESNENESIGAQNAELESDTEQYDIESDRELEESEGLETDKEEEVEESESDKEQDQGKELSSHIEKDKDLIWSREQQEVAESESDREQEQVEFESYSELQPSEDDDSMEVSYHETSRQLRLNSPETYLLKIKQDKAESRRKMQEQVINSLKMARKPCNLFKMPEIPKQSKATITVKKAAKAKPKPSLFSSGMLPPDFLEDMKYKPPKKFQGKNAPWITKRLYKYLEDKLEATYDYRARTRAEKLVEKLHQFAKDVRKCRVAPPEAISALKHEMARLNIVKTHHEFYCFFHEFMPREIRIRVNPDILNKIPAPKRIFAEILEDNHL